MSFINVIARVAPIHMKNSVPEKGNNRPVSVLSAISKIFETAIEKQLSDHFENLFNPFLAAFRSGYGCQSTLQDHICLPKGRYR
jgi:hypothetical protein